MERCVLLSRERNLTTAHVRSFRTPFVALIAMPVLVQALANLIRNRYRYG